MTEGGEVVILNDPDEFEESVCEERVRVCITASGKIAWIEHGGGLVELRHINECVRRAAERYKVWENLLKQATTS
jgi:exosome complex component RRP43